jgi:two-component system, cell cycle sensor histidine kinase and response regulator CckA
VEIVLPRAAQDQDPDLHNGTDPLLPGGSEMILVVEDHDRLRLRVARILQDLGYRVLQAGNAREAVQAYRQDDSRFDLVISGVVMVGATGLNLALQLRALQPDISVLYLSTYAPYALGELNLIEPGARVVRTPLQPEDLARAVRDTLDRRSVPDVDGRS